MNTKPSAEYEDFSDLEPLLEIVSRWDSMTKVFILNPIRAAEMKKAYELIQRIFQEIDRDASIEWHLCPLQTGAANIEVITDLISIENMPEFITAIALADSMSIDCLNTQKFYFALSFNGVLDLLDSR